MTMSWWTAGRVLLPALSGARGGCRFRKELKVLLSACDCSDRYRHTFASTLLAAEPSFLASNKRNILAAMSELDPMLQDDVEDRISDWRLDADGRWDTFVRLVQDDELSIEIDDFYPRGGFVERVECLVRGMGDDARPVRWVLETLPQTINEADYSSARELIAASLAGVLRLEEAIPYLIALLHDEDPWNEDEDEAGWGDDSNASGDPFPPSRPWPVADDSQPTRDLRSMIEVPAGPIINPGEKVRRNDPCPCGSGKKYKKCCLRMR